MLKKIIVFCFCLSIWDVTEHLAHAEPKPIVKEIAIATEAQAQILPNIIWGDPYYLIVWLDYRSGGYYDLYGERVDSKGCMMDQNGFLIDAAIATSTSQTKRPGISWEERHFLVVWEEWVNGIFAGRISPEGNLIDGSGFPILLPGAWNLRVNWGKSNFLIVWTDYRFDAEGDVYGARMSSDGEILDPQGIPIAKLAGSQISVSIASNGQDFFVVWGDTRSGNNNYDIYAARVDEMGNVLDPEGIPISIDPSRQSIPQVVWNGTNYFVVWGDSRNVEPDDCEECLPSDYGDIYGARVSSDGSVLDPEGIEIFNGRLYSRGSSIAWNGEYFFVVWTDLRELPSDCQIECDVEFYSDIYGTRVTPEGEVLDPKGIPICTAEGPQIIPLVSSDGQNFLVVWEDSRLRAEDQHDIRLTDIYGAWISFSESDEEDCEADEETSATTEETTDETEITTEETTEESTDKEERGGGCSFGGQPIERHHANRNGGLILMIGIWFGVTIRRSFKM